MSQLDDLGRRVADLQDLHVVHPGRRAAVRRRLLESTNLSIAPRRTRIVAALAAAAVVLLVALSLSVVRSRPLTFTVEGAPASPGAFVFAPDSANIAVRFSDGTNLSIEPSARARIAAVDANGARVFVEVGTIEVAVVHRIRSNWHFVAGPFDVLVTGTAFRVEWDPVKTRFTLTMRDGHVVVSGGIAGTGQAVDAGEVLIADVSMGRLERRALLALPAAVSAASVEAPPAIAPSQNVSAHPPRAPSIAAWRTLAAEARFVEALAAAEKLGFSTLCATSPPGELYQLGDVARLARSPARATEAFITLRKRFPQDNRAADAAFALGRVSFDARAAYVDAATWFETYLREQPSGPFAREASGRVIEAHHRAGASARARLAAQRYLAAYPEGPHAQLAKSVLAE